MPIFLFFAITGAHQQRVVSHWRMHRAEVASDLVLRRPARGQAGGDPPNAARRAVDDRQVLDEGERDQADQPLRLRARVVESGPDRATVEATLEAGAKVCATCRGVFVAVEPGHPAYGRW